MSRAPVPPRAPRPKLIAPTVDFNLWNTDAGQDGLVCKRLVHRLEEDCCGTGPLAGKEDHWRVEKLGEISDPYAKQLPCSFKDLPRRRIAAIRGGRKPVNRALDRNFIAKIGRGKKRRRLARNGIVGNIGFKAAALTATA